MDKFIYKFIYRLKLFFINFSAVDEIYRHKIIYILCGKIQEKYSLISSIEN